MGSLGILSAKIKFPEAPVAPEVQTILLRMLDVSTRHLYRVVVKEMIWNDMDSFIFHPPTFTVAEDYLYLYL